jgi:hypothetical protein
MSYEKRSAKLLSHKGGSGSTTFRLTLPTLWIRSLGLSEDIRDVQIELIDNQIVITKKDGA